MTNRWTKVAVLVPVLGLVALVGRAEFAVRSGPTWRVSIEGYDPRDLLHGHYLQYRFKFNWQGSDTCGVPGDDGNRNPEPMCCLCLTRSNPDGINPPVRQVWCDEAERECDGWLRADGVQPPLRYFVPQDRAQELEQALRERDASIELASGPGGVPAIRELYLDGKPWRSAHGG